ncbi:MAG: cation:proton antiporter [Gammaproteobacteria bacterium]
MTDFSLLTIALLLLAVTLAAVTALHILRLPTLPAYFIAGIAAGPHGIGILASGEEADFVAELGVIFLLFTIGLEFSISAFNAIRRYVLVLGALQVGVCLIIFGGGGWFLTGDARSAALIGAVAAMSSTAIVSQLLIKENAVTSPAGRRAIAVVLFQDLAVVPLIIIFSSLSGMGDISSLPWVVALIVVKCGVLVIVVFAVFRPIVSKWFNWTHRHGDKELFILNLAALILIAAGLTAFFGLSYSLGAFLAGMIIAETMHRHRVERLVEPFRHLFLGFFFISLGLLIKPSPQYLPPALALAAVFFAIKVVLVYFCTRAIGSFRRTSLRASLLLGGAGEFGFVLLTVAGAGILDEYWFQTVLLANLLAMLPVPIIWPVRERIVNAIFAKVSADAAQNPKAAADGCDIVMSGFGRTGQAVAGVFREMGMGYAVIEDDHRILQAAGGVENIIYGEGERIESLDKSGLARARVFIITYMDTANVLNAVQLAREINPSIWIIAKAENVAQAERFSRAGANEVLIESHESGFSLARVTAKKLGAKMPVVRRTITKGRRRVNSFFSGQYGESEDDSGEPSKHFVGCAVRGDISQADIAELLGGCAVLSWQRDGKVMPVEKMDGLRAGDELVLMSADIAALTDIKNKLEGVSDYFAEE